MNVPTYARSVNLSLHRSYKEMTGNRTYVMRRRAEQRDETRRAIVDATLELHGEIGPVATSYAQIAQRAGVQRKTVYNHFPTEAELFQACSARYRDSKPFPDPESWREIADPELRLQTGLSELYAHFRDSEARWANILRDAEIHPLVRAGAKYRRDYLERVRDVLAVGWGARGTRRTRLLNALGHAVDFYTWRSLRQQGADDETAVQLILGMVRHAAGRCH
jgi:AcrR family transcriptional regulator